ncbi:MAG: ATP-binding protein [Acidobacteriota bacterium]
MVQFDNQAKQIRLKIVYYGPALGGKTTCLQYIHGVTDPGRRTKLYALNTASDRTLFFDLLGLDLGRVRGYRLTLQLFTVPGQVQYNATRRAVLAGADGVVLVADSQRSQVAANLDSLGNLSENLRATGLDPDAIPLVLQYNKRDLPDVVAPEELSAALNPLSRPAFETVATTGQGVMESFAAIVEATVVAVADRLGLSAQWGSVSRLVDTVRSALQPFLGVESRGEPEPAVVMRPASGDAALGEEGLITEAVRVNVAMTELSARLDRLTGDLDRRLGQLRAINEFGRRMALAREPEEVTAGVLERLLGELRAVAGSVVLLGEGGSLVEVLCRGFTSDPLLRSDGEGEPPARAALEAREPFLTQLDDLEPERVETVPWLLEMRHAGLVSAIAVPLLAQDRAMGLVTCYADAHRGAFEDADLELAAVLGANAGVALANARAWRALEQVNRSLEGTVAERTRELQEALARSQSLAAQLEDRNLELEAANLQLRELERLKGDLLRRVAHELNTPVTSIQTAARILARYDQVPPERSAKFIGIIGQEAGRLGELIASALQAAVLGVAEGEPVRKTIPLQDFLRRVLAPLKGDIAARQLVLHVRIAAGLDTLTGDEEQLEAALRAVLRNAVEFNREGGSVTLTVRPLRKGQRHLVEIVVEDTGVGIPAEDLPHACEVFWQGGNVLTDKPKGLGLGLAVARRVAENHDGSLEVASEVGRGTTTTIILPMPIAGAT